MATSEQPNGRKPDTIPQHWREQRANETVLDIGDLMSQVAQAIPDWEVVEGSEEKIWLNPAGVDFLRRHVQLTLGESPKIEIRDREKGYFYMKRVSQIGIDPAGERLTFYKDRETSDSMIDLKNNGSVRITWEDENLGIDTRLDPVLEVSIPEPL